ncbi:trypsin iota-like [Convolutriloba macropyga]|uniref:trypsin iota-like n=1 Tax=Convolutriloba macropyga TaxID=536237 RepID=UPI003F5274D6
MQVPTVNMLLFLLASANVVDLNWTEQEESSIQELYDKGLVVEDGSAEFVVNVEFFGWDSHRECRGILYKKRFILTSYFCVMDMDKNAIVKYGNVSFNEPDPTRYPGEMPWIDFDAVHFDWNSSSQSGIITHDIAILVISCNSLESLPPIRDIVLSDDPKLGSGTPVDVFGYDHGAIRSQLKTISNQECQKEYGKVYIIDDSMLCASAGYISDKCSEDIGGPLILSQSLRNETTDPILVGLITFSFAQSCPMQEYPGIYINIGYYKKWIDLHINYTDECTNTL